MKPTFVTTRQVLRSIIGFIQKIPARPASLPVSLSLWQGRHILFNMPYEGVQINRKLLEEMGMFTSNTLVSQLKAL